MSVDLTKIMRAGRRHTPQCEAVLSLARHQAVMVRCERNKHSASVKHMGTLENAIWKANADSPTVGGDISISWS